MKDREMIVFALFISCLVLDGWMSGGWMSDEG